MLYQYVFVQMDFYPMNLLSVDHVVTFRFSYFTALWSYFNVIVFFKNLSLPKRSTIIWLIFLTVLGNGLLAIRSLCQSVCMFIKTFWLTPYGHLRYHLSNKDINGSKRWISVVLICMRGRGVYRLKFSVFQCKAFWAELITGP